MLGTHVSWSGHNLYPPCPWPYASTERGPEPERDHGIVKEMNPFHASMTPVLAGSIDCLPYLVQKANCSKSPGEFFPNLADYAPRTKPEGFCLPAFRKRINAKPSRPVPSRKSV